MTAVAPTGNGPFEFTDSNGRQVSIPLTALSFDAIGNLVASAPWDALTGVPPAKDLLDYMRAQGIFVPAPAASPKAAAVIKAVDPGPAGNNISIEITNISSDPDPTKKTFDIVATETETYTGLTVATIEDVLGTPTTAGSKPGLVIVRSAPSGLPGALPKTPLKIVAPDVSASLEVKDGGGTVTAFTLEARDAGTDGERIAITIPPPGSTTFDLTAQWTRPATTGVTIGTFQSKVASDLGYLITAAPPGSAGGIFSVPAAGTTNLSGGASSVNASAILIASQ